ncbi:ABC transporter permease [Listeria fleischmannii 1991]|jgi:multiple sugar transport system permease protein|uniref:Inner membrane ABC transporter permease protein ycjP n=3 Tax=Listeria fleischmannii TaxID=1069827 RepID=A0A2X3IZ34_9LIST|nr:carbohydrate ABC transporter permease [Listeria fleischmannii]EIA21074.1 sugar ABC transporter, permease [Listeria fleischmannii subsp. coloradonensis]KMT58331.1 ABC transporter permease [Listeria fleischmannii 1991]MBC1397665.1 carbohydrate ABC transporter permease [Listeria fleischmannii]MBC1417685.1 carbohydrate ABC transporter permease [Listeria fleischmannii]MBC1426794.1 carbohydrate ABC transporter permease [Listeria fleischmannii]
MLKKQYRRKWLVHVLLILGAFMMVFPFFWMIMTSLKTTAESIAIPPSIFPSEWQWHNYKDIFVIFPFGKFYFNTFVSTAVITIGQVFLCAMAAYAFARINFPFKNVLFILILSVLMVPGQIFLIPQYLIIQNMNLLNTIPALFIPGLFSAFGTFLLRQFFMTIPKEIEEAAIIDGCSRVRIFFSIILPLSRSALVSLSIFALLYGWNSLLWPLIVNTSTEKMTLSAGLASLSGQYATNYPLIMAGSFLAIIPLIIAFLLFQKQFIEGIALSGSKN